VAEDGEHTGAIGLDAAIRHFHAQGGQVFDDGLGGCESLGSHWDVLRFSA
jgi:hypothetical protein